MERDSFIHSINAFKKTAILLNSIDSVLGNINENFKDPSFGASQLSLDIKNAKRHQLLKVEVEGKPIDIMEQFRKDMERDQKFRLVDQHVNLLEHVYQDLKEGALAIHQAVEISHDQKWEFILQNIATQTNGNLLFSDIKFMMLLQSENLRMMEDSYVVAAKGPKNGCPRIEIIRDAKTNKIARLDVKYTGSLEIHLNSTLNGVEKMLTLPGMINGQLNYSITLKDDQPVFDVQNLQLIYNK
jgi:hypothetical protein